MTSGLDAAHPDDRARDTRARTSATCASAIARTAGPDTPPVRPPSHGSPGRRGSNAIPRSVLISDTASAPCSTRGGGDGGGRGAVRRQLHDQRLVRPRADVRRRSAAVSARVGAHDHPRLDVRAGDVELERRDLLALGERGHERRDLVAGEAHDVDDQRHGQLGELRQVLARGSRARPLLGSPIELIIPPGCSHSRGGGLPWRGSTCDRLGDVGGEREALEQRVAERAPRGDRVERPGGVDDRVRERDAEEVDQCPLPGISAVSRSAASSTGPSTHRRT